MTQPNSVASPSAWALIVLLYRSTASMTSATSSQTTLDSSNESNFAIWSAEDEVLCRGVGPPYEIL